jgi:hypothetical protein
MSSACGSWFSMQEIVVLEVWSRGTTMCKEIRNKPVQLPDGARGVLARPNITDYKRCVKERLRKRRGKRSVTGGSIKPSL